MATIAYHHPGDGEKNKKDLSKLDRFNNLTEEEGEEEFIEDPDDSNEPFVEDDEDKVEVVDDTPDEDKGRDAAPLDSSYEEQDAAIEAELKQIQGSKGLQRRIPEVIKQRNEERRAKEAESRARIEATNYARVMHERAMALEKMLEDSNKSGIQNSQAAAASNLERARQAARDAFESADSDLIAKAQEDLQRAVLQSEMVRNARPQQLPPAPAPPQMATLDPKTERWVAKNGWFTKNRTLTQAAMDFHGEAVSRGLTPQEDSYYSFIDTKMKPLLSAYGLAPETSTGQSVEKKKVADTVTPVSRSNGAAQRRESAPPNRITLTRSQAQLAVDLMPDLPPAKARELYARQLKKSSSV